MSVKTTIAVSAFAAVLTALAIGAAVSFVPGEAKANVQCTTPFGGTQPLCVNAPVLAPGAVVGGVNPNRHCYYLPTVSDGRVTGVHQVCS